MSLILLFLLLLILMFGVLVYLLKPTSMEKAVRKQIASAVTLVLQVTRFSDGTRRLTYISEITGMEDDVVSMQDVFVFEKQGVSPDGRTLGTFTATGIRPKFAEKLTASGITLPPNMFEQTIRRWN
jgi:pilus assembly protein CpaF